MAQQTTQDDIKQLRQIDNFYQYVKNLDPNGIYIERKGRAIFKIKVKDRINMSRIPVNQTSFEKLMKALETSNKNIKIELEIGSKLSAKSLQDLGQMLKSNDHVLMHGIELDYDGDIRIYNNTYITALKELFDILQKRKEDNINDWKYFHFRIVHPYRHRDDSYSTKVIQKLIEYRNCSITTLRLQNLPSFNNTSLLRRFGSSLSKNTSIVELDMSYNEAVNDEVVETLCPYLKENKTIRTINFDGCELGDESIDHLIDLVKSKPNYKLLLDSQRTGDEIDSDEFAEFFFQIHIYDNDGITPNGFRKLKRFQGKFYKCIHMIMKN